MRLLTLGEPGAPLSVLCIGAHSDDIEIGIGGTILSWIATGVKLHVHWCVLSATGSRATEAEASAVAFLNGAASVQIDTGATMRTRIIGKSPTSPGTASATT